MIKFDIDRKIRFKKVEEFLELPRIIVVNNFNESDVNSFRNDFADALKTGQEIIPIVIDSYGGQLYSLLAMTDIIKTSTVPVATIVSGKAMSCGSILLSCGTEGYRYVGDRASVLIHPIRAGAFGNEDDINVKAKEIKRLTKVCYRMMAKNCKLDKNYFINKMKEKRNADWYLTPKECVDINLAQHIGTPMFNISVNVGVEFKV